MGNYEENDQSIKDEFEKKKKSVTEDDIVDVINKEKAISKKAKKGPLAKLWIEIKLMLSMLKDYKSGAYRDVSWGTIASIIAALLYVFSPIDLIPDMIPVIGLIDDAAVVALCLKLIHNDFEKYKKFKENQKSNEETTVDGL